MKNQFRSPSRTSNRATGPRRFTKPISWARPERFTKNQDTIRSSGADVYGSISKRRRHGSRTKRDAAVHRPTGQTQPTTGAGLDKKGVGRQRAGTSPPAPVEDAP